MKDFNLDSAVITEIQFFDYTYERQIGEDEYEEIKEYGANIAINDCLLVQLSGNGDEAHKVDIPSSDEQYWNDKELQDWACENLGTDEVEKFLDKEGIENNFYYLEEHGEKVL